MFEKLQTTPNSNLPKNNCYMHKHLTKKAFPKELSTDFQQKRTKTLQKQMLISEIYVISIKMSSINMTPI